EQLGAGGEGGGDWNGVPSASPTSARLRRSVSSSPIYSPVRKRKPDLGPVVRDRYGFRRSFEHISREDQEAFDTYYAGVCDKRRVKWDALLKRSGGNMPARSDRLKRDMEDNPGLYTMLTYREEQDKAMGYTREKNKILEFIEVLDKDLHRTFPENVHFNPKSSNGGQSSNSAEPRPANFYMQSPYLRCLRRILVAFAYFSWPHPNETRTPPRVCSYPIGYCQSLNFIVGLLLLVDGQTSGDNGEPGGGNGAVFENMAHENWERVTARVEERTFWLLVAIVERLLPPEMYGANLEGAQIAQEILWKWLLGVRGGRFGVGKVAKWVDGMEGSDLSSRRRPIALRSKSRSRQPSGGNAGMPPLSMVTTSWFMTIYVNVLPVETVLRVWDCFFYQGEKVLMRVALTLIKIHEDEVLACSDTSDAWKLIKDIPPRMVDCHRFMEICFKPRVNLNPFEDSSANSSSQSLGSAASSVTSSPGSIRRSSAGGDDSDDEAGIASPVIQNDPLRRYGEGASLAGGAAAAARKSRIPRRGVGSVSRKMIAHYRSLALAERQEQREREKGRVAKAE
ncbi:hypothetical protein HK405_013374, partial [Cladochytrium tenue]